MPMQDHIHLDLTVGGIENAPISTFTVVRFDLDPNIIESTDRDLLGNLRVHQLVDASGPIIFWNYTYLIKITSDLVQTAREQLDDLMAWRGQTVYLVEHEHPNDGADHAAHVKTMHLSSVSNIREIDPLWQNILVEIELVDNHL